MMIFDFCYTFISSVTDFHFHFEHPIRTETLYSIDDVDDVKKNPVESNPPKHYIKFSIMESIEIHLNSIIWPKLP